MKGIERVVNPQRLVHIPFCKTECGTDFYINTGDCREISGVLTENKRFETDFFEFFFFRKGNGYLLLETRKVELKDNLVLLISPHRQVGGRRVATGVPIPHIQGGFHAYLHR